MIYYLEGEENNALMSLDCETGAVKTVIPGIKGVYEGARPLFKNVVASAGKILLQVSKEPKQGIYIWDGKSLSTSKKLGEGALEMCASNGKYVIIYSEPKNKDGSTKQCYRLWDMEQMDYLLTFPMYDDMSAQTVYYNLNRALVDSNGNVWMPYRRGLLRVPREGGTGTNYQIEGEYIDMLRDENSYGWDSDLKRSQIALTDDHIYVAFHRRIFRMSLSQPGTWEEYAKVPPTQQGDFARIFAFSDGSLLTWSDVNSDFATQFYPAEKLDSPVNLGVRPKLPTTGGWINRDWECWLSLNVMRSDMKGNILVLTNGRGFVHNSLDTGDLWVINPRGVVGYKNVVGKVLKMN